MEPFHLPLVPRTVRANDGASAAANVSASALLGYPAVGTAQVSRLDGALLGYMGCSAQVSRVDGAKSFSVTSQTHAMNHLHMQSRIVGQGGVQFGRRNTEGTGRWTAPTHVEPSRRHPPHTSHCPSSLSALPPLNFVL